MRHRCAAGRTHRATALALTVVVILGSSACRVPAGDSATGSAGARKIVRVVDGDTLVVEPAERIRLIGVDAPESVAPNKPVECMGREASRFLSGLLPKGTEVRLEFDVERIDRYGRTLAYVWVSNSGLFVNAELVRQGFAQQLTIPPNVAHADEFAALTLEARRADRGLWSACSKAPYG